MDNSKNIESTVHLKDGRVIFKTNNGFTYWVSNISTSEEIEEVSEEYYTKALKHRVNK